MARAEPAEAVYVERLDLAAAGYYLVPFYAEETLTGIVEVDAQSCRVTKSGVIGREGVPFMLEPAAAIRAAAAALGSSDPGKPWLAWRPCKESFESFLPFWTIDCGGNRLYVDQAGKVHKTLTITGKGGGSAT